MDRTIQFRRLVAGLRDADEFAGAICAEVGGDLWFPPDGGLSRELLVAIQLCKECPVRRLCLEAALASKDHITRYGVWAGHTERSLRRMRRFRAALKAATHEGVPDVAA